MRKSGKGLLAVEGLLNQQSRRNRTTAPYPLISFRLGSMATQTQQRRERDTSRAYNISRAAVVIAILALGWQVIQFFYQKHSYERKFGNIETSIRLLTATVAPQLQKAIDDSLVSALTDTPIQASQTLAKVASDTANLRQLKAPLPTQQISRTSALLERVVNQYPEDASAWGAAAQMVSYRSELQGEVVERPDCFKSQADGQPGRTMVERIYNDCTLNLDDAATFNILAPKLYQDHPDGTRSVGQISLTLVLTNGTVTYSGGPIIAIERLLCRNCSFKLRTPETVPPLPGRALSQQLLTANLSDVSVTLPKAETQKGSVDKRPISSHRNLPA